MSLVQYPDSDSDDDRNEDVLGAPTATAKTQLKRKRSGSGRARTLELPPLPAAFIDLYSTNARTSTGDDPSLHGGRKRAVPHIVGNYPSHVYLEWIPSQIESEELHKLTEAVQRSIESANKRLKKPLPVPDITSSLLSPLGTPLPLHISLSRTLQIRTEDREHFLGTVTSCLRRAAIRPFEIDFSNLKWVPNFERNRWFLVLSIAKPPNDELNRLLWACNEGAERCGHPGLYTGSRGDGPMEGHISSGTVKRKKSSSSDASPKGPISELTDRSENFHISIAWNLVEPVSEWIDLVRDVDVDDHLKHCRVSFDVVKAKIGNAIHSIELSSRKSRHGSSGGILGAGYLSF